MAQEIQRVRVLHEQLTEVQEHFTATIGRFNASIAHVLQGVPNITGSPARLREEAASSLSIKLRTEAQRFLGSIKENPLLPLAFFGASKAGKSSLLNFLLGKLMPSDEKLATARICRISYCPLEESSIHFLLLNPETGGFRSAPNLMPIALQSFDHLKAELIALLTRPESLDPDWVSTVIHVRYPFSLLSPGFDLYDLPGVASIEHPAIRENLSLFLRVVQPIIAFIYAQPILAESEVSALHFLRANLTRFQEEYIPPDLRNPILFISNHMDLDHFDTLDWDQTPEHLEQLIQEVYDKRYELLLAQRAATRLPQDPKNCSSFTCISARDCLIARKAVAIRPITDKFFEVFTNFILIANKKRLAYALQLLIAAAGQFYHDLLTIRQQNWDVVFEQAEAAIMCIGKARTQTMKNLEKILLKIPTYLQKQVDQQLGAALDRAAAIRLPQDGKVLTRAVEAMAISSFQVAFSPWIQDNIIQPVFSSLRSEIMKEVRAIRELMGQVLGGEDFGEELVEIFFQLPPPPTGFFSLLFDLFRFGFPFLAARDDRVDASYKRELGKMMLSSLSAASEPMEMKKFEEFFKNRLDPIVEERRNHLVRLRKHQMRLKPVFTANRFNFAKLIGELMALQSTVLYELPKLETEIGRGAFGIVFSAIFDGKCSVVKEPIFDSAQGDREVMSASFFEEVYFTKLMTDKARVSQYLSSLALEEPETEPLSSLSAPGPSIVGSSTSVAPPLTTIFHSHIVEYQAFFRVPIAEKFWLVMPRYESNLSKYLTETPDRTLLQSLRLALALARGLSRIHSYNIIHRDLKLENTLISPSLSPDDPSKTLVISDFGLATQGKADDVAGTPIYMSAAIYRDPYLPLKGYGHEVDIYALGIFLAELYPGPFTRGLPSIYKIRDDSYLSIVRRCLSNDELSRPTAHEVVQLLEERLKSLL